MGIRRKIFVGFLVICFLLFLSGLVATVEMNRLQRSVSGLLSQKLEAVLTLHQIESAINEQISEILYALPEDSKNSKQFDTKKITGYVHSLQQNNYLVVGDTLSLVHLENLLEDFGHKFNEYANLREDDFLARHTWYTQNLHPVDAEIHQEIESLIETNKIELQKVSAEIEQGFYRSNIPALIAVGIGILLVLLFNYLINLYFVNPLVRITEGIRKTLSYRTPYIVDVDSNDELKDLNDSVIELVGERKNKENANT